MFPEYLKSEQPFATKLFSAAINTNRLAQAYLFTQAQAIVQYHFALELAKIVNCTNKLNGLACNSCLDCKWINSNTHPAVITISPVDFLPKKDDISADVKTSKSRSMISVDQARFLRKQLSTTSKYYRVVIFTNASTTKIPDEIYQTLWLDFKGKVMPPGNESGREYWICDYLKYNSFGLMAEAANILLKTIEEPLGKVLFIFITKDQDDTISTIVSRCQTVPLLRKSDMELEPIEYLQEIKSWLPPKNELESIKIAKQILDFSKKEGIELENLIEYVEKIYFKQVTNQISNQNLFNPTLIKQLIKIEKTKEMIKGYVNPQSALISMLNQLITI